MARISSADSLRLVDQLAAAARGGGAGATQATQQLTQLRQVAPPEAYAVIDGIINGSDGSIESRLMAARDAVASALVTTSDTTDWSQFGVGLQSSRGVAVMEIRRSAISESIFLAGKLGKDAEGFLTLNVGGKEYQVTLPDKSRMVPYPESWRSIQMPWVNGMLEEQTVILKGRITADDTKIAMEGFNVKLPGRPDMETFTPCRVVSRVGEDETALSLMQTNNVPADVPAVISTADGVAFIKDPELAKQLSVLPKLACMLPGEPTRQPDGTLVYDIKPKDLNIFLRVMAAPEGNTYPADTAWSHFSGKPVSVPEQFIARAKQVHDDHGDACVWALGSFGFDAAGEAARFDSSWMSKAAEKSETRLRPHE